MPTLVLLTSQLLKQGVWNVFLNICFVLGSDFTP